MFALFRVDYGEYNAFKRAIKSEGFEIKKRWIYEEDFVLEDFGFYVEKADHKFWLDVRNLSNVRTPDAKIAGILLESMHEGLHNRERVVAFDSDLWKEAHLPTVSTPREFLSQAHLILPWIYKSKARLQQIQGGTYDKARFGNFLIIRDDPSDLAHTIYLSDES